jgi:hypothetical protein
MRSDGLLSHDWAVITDYIEILRPLKTATKRLEGHTFGAIAEIIPVFEVLLNNIELKLSQFEAVRHDEHDESPKDHLTINLRAAILKAREYYNKLDHTPAYYAATRLHPRYKYFTDTAWADKPDWIELNNRNFNALWAEYKCLPRPRTRPKKLCSDLDDAINSFIDPIAGSDQDEDEYERWKRCEPIVGQDSPANKHPIKYWLGLRDQYPNLTKLAIDVLSIPASSCECERVFSELGDLLEPRRRNIGPELLAAIQCVRRWLRDKFGDDEVANKATITDQELELVYRLSTWDDSLLNTI